MLSLVGVDSDGVFPAHNNHPVCFIQGANGWKAQEIEVMREHIFLFKKQETFFDVFAEDVTGVSVGALGIELLLEKLWDGELVGVNPGEVFGLGIVDFQVLAHGLPPCGEIAFMPFGRFVSPFAPKNFKCHKNLLRPIHGHPWLAMVTDNAHKASLPITSGS
jgi:hypothetical protein